MFVSLIYATNILLIDRAFIASGNSVFNFNTPTQEMLSTWLKFLFRLALVTLTGLLASLSLELAINEVSITKRYLDNKISQYNLEIGNINTELSTNINSSLKTVDNVFCSSEVKSYGVAEENVEKSFDYSVRLRGPKTIDAEQNLDSKKLALHNCRNKHKTEYSQVEMQKNNLVSRMEKAINNREAARKLLMYIKGEIQITAFNNTEKVLPKITIAEKRKLLDEIKENNSAFNEFSILVVLALMMIEVMPLLLKWVMHSQVQEYDNEYQKT